MFKLTKGSLITTIYNKEDINLYIQAGWTLLEDSKEEPKNEKKAKAQKKENNEQNNSNRDIIKE